ncbi:hypothetical protein [Caballeronia glathei]|uniref:Uncharacterized protein n=1 Tax=Caballeronia glathei TaxID=60547 RepID=A0A069PGV4_9BURK|nr:hypothetical protein [Caballeronia glathei]KDR39953.1 hypothetical protein BG61_28560 [Caballeronia glathei]
MFNDAVSAFNNGLDLTDSASSSVKSMLANPLDFLVARATTLIPDVVAMANTIFGMFTRGESIIEQLDGLRRRKGIVA